MTLPIRGTPRSPYTGHMEDITKFSETYGNGYQWERLVSSQWKILEIVRRVRVHLSLGSGGSKALLATVSQGNLLEVPAGANQG